MFNYRLILAGTAAAAIPASLAFADPVVSFTEGPGNTQGGIYIAHTDEFGDFETFCIESQEGMTIGFTFEYTISTDIMFNGDGTADPLDAESAYLYTQFLADEIRNILGKPNLPDDKVADAVQLALWLLEEGRATNDPNAQALAQDAEDAVNNGQWSGLGQVRVMNVWNPGHVGDPLHAKQDVLVLIPGPSSLALAGLGFGFAAVRRRR